LYIHACRREENFNEAFSEQVALNENLKLWKEQEKADILMEKVKRAIILSSRKFLKEAKAQNRKLVVMRNDKVVLIKARGIK
jgi:hypothetical protein